MGQLAGTAAMDSNKPRPDLKTYEAVGDRPVLRFGRMG